MTFCWWQPSSTEKSILAKCQALPSGIVNQVIRMPLHVSHTQLAGVVTWEEGIHFVLAGCGDLSLGYSLHEVLMGIIASLLADMHQPWKPSTQCFSERLQLCITAPSCDALMRTA